MSENHALTLRGVSKAYRIWEQPAARLINLVWEALASVTPASSASSAYFNRRAAQNYRDFWALRDVTFAVKKGESIGLVGRNGSGKSTLLQLIASTLRPTNGEVKVNGRVAALLELGAGFDTEFTGRENAYVNAAILGLSRTEIDAQISAIAAFAELGDFFDQPVKTYSSGMVVRLAFAVAAHVKPDILIVDEALSVGDARFQLKCARRIDRFISEGVTLLFVSHDLSLVKRLCQRALLIDSGKVLYSGHPNDVANLYSKLLADGGSAETIAGDIETLKKRLQSPDSAGEKRSAIDPLAVPAEPISTRDAALLASDPSSGQNSGDEFSYGGEKGEIRGLGSFSSTGEPRLHFSSGEIGVFRIHVVAHESINAPIYAFTLKNASGVEIYGTNTHFAQQTLPAIHAGERHQIDFQCPLNLPAGVYFLSFGFTQFVGDHLTVIHRRYDALKIDIHTANRSLGLVDLRAAISAIKL
ncbi:MAG: ABC transporter ATP-binding protein [Nibricoccus sp.]